MMPKDHRPSPKAFDLFKSECEYWLDELGLMG